MKFILSLFLVYAIKNSDPIRFDHGVAIIEPSVKIQIGDV